MIDVHMVCSHDALKLAEMLMRLLEAEEHRVRLSYGRQALGALDEAAGSPDAVILIWSPNARAQTYMHAWAQRIEPRRLVELALGASDWPTIKRVAPVIDFTGWRGQRGARPWKALTERLHAVAGALGPHRAPTKAMMAIGLAGVAAVASAVMTRPETPIEHLEVGAPLEELTATDSHIGVGGPLTAIEPASIEDEVLSMRRFRAIEPITDQATDPLAPVPEFELLELRDRTFLERLNAYNPLRRRSQEPT